MQELNDRRKPMPRATSASREPRFPDNSWRGFRRHDFLLGKNEVIIVRPEKEAPGRRWVWRAEFFDVFPAFDVAMLRCGWWLAFIRVGDTYGCPSAMRRFDAFYRELTGKYGFHPRPVLEGLSRGGLYVYNWAVRNTGRVGLVYADNAVCDFKSWPGGKGKGPGGAANWALLKQCYGFRNDAQALTWRGNPVDNAAPIVNAGIPLVHVFGDADETVPWDENTGVMAERVRALGGTIRLERKRGCRHHPHGPKRPAALADWVVRNALA
jgi:hypothetical protein